MATETRVGLGTYRLGAETYRVCRDALDLGYRHIDTASLYGNQTAVGEAVRSSGIDRDQITVTSKVWVDDIRAGRVADAVAESVERIGRVDVMLLHAPVGDPAEMGEAWEALRQGCELHGVADAGVSNFEQRHVESLSPTPAVNQIELSPFWSRRALVNLCQTWGIRVTAHSPLAKGRRLDDPILCAVAGEIEVGGTCATPAQVMLAWSIANGFLPLPRSRSADRLAENLVAAEIELRSDQLDRLAQLDDGFATHPQHR